MRDEHRMKRTFFPKDLHTVTLVPSEMVEVSTKPRSTFISGTKLSWSRLTDPPFTKSPHAGSFLVCGSVRSLACNLCTRPASPLRGSDLQSEVPPPSSLAPESKSGTAVTVWALWILSTLVSDSVVWDPKETQMQSLVGFYVKRLCCQIFTEIKHAKGTNLFHFSKHPNQVLSNQFLQILG